jgi:hypothetical protein
MSGDYPGNAPKRRAVAEAESELVTEIELVETEGGAPAGSPRGPGSVNAGAGFGW